MEELLGALLRLYLPLLVALVCSKTRKVKEEAIEDLSKITLYYSLPILLFASIYKKEVGAALYEALFLVGASLFAVATSMGAGALLYGGDREFAFVSSIPNMVFLPVPLAHVLWGPEAVSLIGFYTLGASPVANALAPIMMGRGSILLGLKRVAKFPPIYAIFMRVVVRSRASCCPTS